MKTITTSYVYDFLHRYDISIEIILLFIISSLIQNFVIFADSILTTKWQFFFPTSHGITLNCRWTKNFVSWITFICCFTQSIIRSLCLYSTIFWNWRWSTYSCEKKENVLISKLTTAMKVGGNNHYFSHDDARV